MAPHGDRTVRDLSDGYRLVQAWGNGTGFDAVAPTSPDWFNSDEQPGLFPLFAVEHPAGRWHVIIACPAGDGFTTRPTTLAHGWGLACGHLVAQGVYP